MSSSDTSTLSTICFVAASAVLTVALRSNLLKTTQSSTPAQSITPAQSSTPSETTTRKSRKQRDQAPEVDRLLYQFKPIGVCRSIFAEKWGTPRQGALAPNTRGHFKLYPTVAHTALNGIEQFSHVWVIFVFSENTNSEKENKFVHGPKNFTFPAKIKPPLLMGRTTGIFSTRTPHRPNNIGMTLCRVVSVDAPNRTVVLSGVDLVDNTPILDIKPYVPADQTTHAHFASWLKPPDKPLRVEFVPEAVDQLKELIKRKVPLFYDTLEGVQEGIVDVLQLDIRGIHQARGEKDNRKMQKCTLDNMAIFFHMLEIENDDEDDNDPASNDDLTPNVPTGNTGDASANVDDKKEKEEEAEEMEMPALSKRERLLLKGDQLKRAPKNIYVKVVEVSGDLTRCWLDFSKGKIVDAPSASEHSALRVRKY